MSVIETLSQTVDPAVLTEPVGAESTAENEKSPELEVPVWDIRPKGPQGYADGAGARQIARLRHMEDLGAVASTEVPFEGSGTVTSFRQGVIVEENVIACVPIPMTEMTPNDPEASGWVTPLRKV